jgi:putative addiction module killer protein
MENKVVLTAEFARWLADVVDETALAAIVSRIDRIPFGLFGDDAWVFDRVSELRIHYGPGYRVYYMIRERTIVFMLASATKRTHMKDLRRAMDIERSLLGKKPMTVETIAFEPERYLQTPKAQVHFLTDVVETGNALYIAHALGVVARALACRNSPAIPA